MGILRKYLWLVLPIVFFANYASADTCENDPYACTPAKLCSKTTEKINNVLYWISSEEDKHLKIARKIKLNCGAKDAMSSCQKDASECSILELCEMSVTKEVSATNWNEINPRHVKLAKSFSLDCGVSPSANSNTLTSPCDENPSACISEELCEKATYGVVGNKNWTTPQVFAEFVKEAKQRGLTCGVNSTSIDKTCSQDVLKCTPFELCKLATKKNANGKSIWSMAEYRKKYIEEAQRRNISCGVNIRAKNDKICSQDVLKCTPSELCDAATYTINKTTDWKVGAYKKYVKEAKRQNISCGVKVDIKVDIEDVKIAKLIKIFSDANNSCRGASADKISTWEKCVERTKTSQALQKYGFCYGKASDDGAYKYRWHECEEASYRIDKKQHEKSLIKYQNKIEGITRERKSALETQKKGKADEKARLALASEEKRKADEKEELTPKAKSLFEDIMLTNSQYQKHLYDEVTGIFDEKKVTQTLLLTNHYNEMIKQKSPEIMKHLEKIIKATSPKYIEASLNYIAFQVEVFKEITTNKSLYSNLMAGGFLDLFTGSLGGEYGKAMSSMKKQSYFDAYKQAGTNLYNRGSELGIKTKLNFEIAASEGVYQAKYKLEEMNARYLNYVKPPENAPRSVAPAYRMKFNPVNIRDPLNLKRFD